MRYFVDNAKAQIGHIAVFVLGFVMVAVAVVAVLAQKSIRQTTGQAYLVADTYGGVASNGTYFSANVSNAMVDPAMGLGAFALLILAALAILAAVGYVASKGW